MKINHLFAFFGATALMATSCSNDEEYLASQETATPKISVVELADYLPASSRGEISSDEKVLKFESMEAYQETVSALEGMDDNERVEFFEDLKFDGAYMLVAKADAEIDELFDRAEQCDSVTGCQMIFDYMAKYEGKLQFVGEQDGEWDVTPMLPYEGEEVEFVGSQSGYIVIGDELIEPTLRETSSEDTSIKAATGPLYDGKLIEYKNVTVKNGKYTSYFRFGRKGSYLGFKTETYRKILFFKKHDNKCNYDGYLEVTSTNNKYRFSCTIKCKKGEWAIKECIAANYSPYLNLKVSNFSSTRNSKNKTTKTINKVLVK